MGYELLVGPVGCESGRSNSCTDKCWGPIFGSIRTERIYRVSTHSQLGVNKLELVSRADIIYSAFLSKRTPF